MSLRRLACLLLAAGAACSSPADPEDPPMPAAGYTEPPRFVEPGVECTQDAPAPSIDPALLDALPPAPENIDSEWADIARRVPGGWGGFLYDEGTPTIYLVDPAQREAAIDALQVEGIPMPHSGLIRKGRWDFAQLHEWYQYLRVHVAIAGTSSTDIDEASNRIVFNAVDEETRAEMEEIAASLGLPCYLLAIGIRPYGTLL